MHIQELIFQLQRFWVDQGCLIGQTYDIEKGAGTMNPLTFFGAIGSKPWNLIYVEPSRRPTDGRYGENPFRLYKHLQIQVLLKPSQIEVQDIYIKSLEAIGIDLRKHDLRFEEDNWEAPTLGAWGVGWQVMLDGMEITQFTYFQQMGGLECRPVSVEITYGVERICMFLTGIDNIFELSWGSMRTNNTIAPVLYGDMRQREEFEFSAYSFEHANLKLHWQMLDAFKEEAWKLLKDYGHFLSGYEQTLKMSHTFNVLDARGAVSTTERPRIIKQIRELSCACAKLYLEHEKNISNTNKGKEA
jgi:glycyl-tRNA synthetase alpha chain